MPDEEIKMCYDKLDQRRIAAISNMSQEQLVRAYHTANQKYSTTLFSDLKDMHDQEQRYIQHVIRWHHCKVLSFD